MKKKLVIINTFLLLAMLATTVYAFFTYILGTEPIIIITGDVKCSAKVFIGEDSDYDGVLDYGKGYHEVDPISGQSDLTITTIIPGRMLSYRVTITNEGTVPAIPDLGFVLNSTLLEKDGEDRYYTTALVYLFAFENFSHRIYENESDNTPLVYDTDNSLNSYMLSAVADNGPFLLLEEAIIFPGETIEIFFKLKCLELSAIEAYINEREDIFLPGDFMQQLNFQIYFESKNRFKLDYLCIGLRSTPIRK